MRLAPGGQKLNTHLGRVNFLLTLSIACASSLALGEPRRLFLHEDQGVRGPLNEFQTRSADLRRRRDIQLFLEAGEAGPELSTKLRTIDNILSECQCKYDPPPQERDDDTNALSRERVA